MKSRIFNIAIIAEFTEVQEPAEFGQLVLKALQSNGMPKGIARIDVQGYDELEVAEALADQVLETTDEPIERKLNGSLN